MLFNSYTFLVFFAVVLILHNLPFSWKTKKINLLLASYVFYAAWNPPFILLLWLSTLVDFFVGRALYTQENKHKKKLLLVISLIGNLGMLCYFKYGGFILENFTHLVNALGVNFHPAKPNIILPAGISFYTFTTLCYTIDMYKKESKPVKSLLDFSLFVTFFPHLVAGPIVRPPQLVPQFLTPRKANSQQMMQGLFLLSLGLFMKVFLADGMLATPANAVFGATDPLKTIDAWMGVLAFSGQIFFDFAGYSSCAIGAALCLGFILPQNFLFPYAAVGFTDFWRRWHITLSSWLRDYLYIPLGGNRLGKFRTYFNLMITMLLGGLWHGANWTFVVWGALHGFYLWIEKAFRDLRNRSKGIPMFVATEEQLVKASFGPTLKRPVEGSFPPERNHPKNLTNFTLALGTFFLVNVTWVFFRSPDFSSAWRILRSMFINIPKGTAVLGYLDIYKVAIITVVLVIAHWLMRNTMVLKVAGKMPWWLLGITWSIMILLIMLSQNATSSFIYFQF
jgi:alginate O-acetyltransferase complex protein AlgI